jgi:S1-C subfamily serine protease
MIATLRRLLLASAGAIVLSATGLAQVGADLSKIISQAEAAYDRADYDEAIRWYRLAADQGLASAQFNLGIIYANNRGILRNDAEAARWYRLAAEQGHAEAQYNLGIFYTNGQGLPQSYAEAARWYRLAADQGLASAQYNLGIIYANGRGMPQNDIEAYKWFSLAAAQSHSRAANNRDIVRAKMTPAQIAEGQRLAAAWQSFATHDAEPKAAPRSPSAGTEVGSTGSGFFVTTAGHVLTNAHVVEGCARISLAGGPPLTLLDIDLGSDLALLRKGGTSTTASLILRQGRGVRLADSIVVAGYPLTGLLSSGLNVTTGAVSALAGPGDDRRLIQVTAPVQPGNSGGPLLDSSGNVVGVVVSKLDAVKVASITGDIPQNVNFAISLGTLQAFLDSNDVDYQTRASSTPRSNADIAELAKAATVQIECRN